MKILVLHIALFAFVFCTLISCNSQKKPCDESIVSDSVKIVLHDTVIKCSVDTFLNDYASIISGKEPTKYFRTVYNTDSWKKIQQSIDQEWQYVLVNKINKIKSWTDSTMHNVTSSHNLIYPFAGADFLYANLFYTNADNTVMIGLEEPGAVMVDTTDLNKFLGHVTKVYKSLYYSNHAGFFRTLSMKEELNEPDLNGTIPALLFYISKMGYSISSVKNIEIDSLGSLSFSNSTHTYACQIEYFNQDNRLRRLYYIKYDLSDYSMSSDSRLVKFLDKFNDPNVLIKSASYLMRSDNFSVIRNYLLNKSHCLLQDDSGVPFKYFDKTVWNVLLFGKYSKTIPLFKNSFQPDLRDAFQNSPVGNLPFNIGYNINHGEPILILTTCKKDK